MSIRKRGNVYQVSYRVPGETSPRTETYKTEDEAMIRDAQIRIAKKSGNFEAPIRIAKGKLAQKKDITVKEFLDEYVELYGLKKWGNSFYSANTGLIKNYIVPHIGDHFVRSLTTRDIDAYYTMLLDQPAVLLPGRHDTGAKITADTVTRIHKLLKSAFGKAVAWEYCKTNPTIGATLPEQRSKERDVWSDDEAIHALEVCDNPVLQTCMYLALGCSMRLGEILGLQWSNVHFGNRTMAGEAYLKVDRELDRCSNESISALEQVSRSTVIFKFPCVIPKKATTTLVLKAPKTQSSVRTIYLPKAVVDELRSVKLQQEQYKKLMGDEYYDYDLVVAQINGRPYEQRGIDKMFYKLIEKYSLRPVVFHSLRHSSTSLKLKLSGGNIKAVQGDTGHAEARMVTDTYAHGFDSDRKLIAQEMDTGFFSKIGAAESSEEADGETVELLKKLIRQHPELVTELLKESAGSQ